MSESAFPERTYHANILVTLQSACRDISTIKLNIHITCIFAVTRYILLHYFLLMVRSFAAINTHLASRMANKVFNCFLTEGCWGGRIGREVKLVCARDNNTHTNTHRRNAHRTIGRERRGAQGARSGEAAGASSDGGRLADPAAAHRTMHWVAIAPSSQQHYTANQR